MKENYNKYQVSCIYGPVCTVQYSFLYMFKLKYSLICYLEPVPYC